MTDPFRTVSLRRSARANQVQAEMSRKEECEVIDLLSDTDDQDEMPVSPVKPVDINVAKSGVIIVKAKANVKATKAKPMARGKKGPTIKLNDDEVADQDEENGEGKRGDGRPDKTLDCKS